MPLSNRISLNTLTQLLTRGTEFAAGFAVNAWLARHWGSQVFGQIGFISGLVGVGSFLFDFGLGVLLTRKIACQPKDTSTAVANGLWTILPLGLLGSLAVLAIGVATGGPHLGPAIALACLQMTLSAAVGILRAAFFAFERMELEALAVFADRITWVAAGIYLATKPPSLVALFAWLSACKVLNLGMSAVLYWLAICGRSTPARPSLRQQLRLLREALPFGLNTVFSTVYVSADIVLLGWMVGGEQVGHYRAASMLVTPLAVIAIALNNALFPRMSAAFVSNRSAIGAFAASSARLVTAAGIPIALFLILFASRVIRLAYGPHFDPAALMLQIIAVVVPLRFLNTSLSNALTAYHEQAWRTLVAGVGAGFNVVANLLILRHYGALGACITTVLTDSLMVGLLWHRLRAVTGELGGGLPTLVSSTAISGVILLPLAWLGVPAVQTLCILCLAYPYVMLKSGLLKPGEVRLLTKGEVS